MVLANFTEEPQSTCDFGDKLFNISDIGELIPLNYSNNCELLIESVVDIQSTPRMVSRVSPKEIVDAC